MSSSGLKSLARFFVPLIFSHISVSVTKLLLLRVVAFSEKSLASVGLGMTLYAWLTLPVSTDLQAVTLVMVHSRHDRRKALTLTAGACVFITLLFIVLCVTQLGDVIMTSLFNLSEETLHSLQIYLLAMIPNIWLQAFSFFHFGLHLHYQLSGNVTVASLMELALQVILFKSL